MSKTLLKGGRLVDPASRTDTRADVLVDDGRVAEVGPGLDAGRAEVVDCDGLVVCPGLVDLHVHLREPGREDAETIETGSRAAALGGYTAVCPMPNTDPVADNAGVVEMVAARGREVGLVDVFPVGAVTLGQRGSELAELGAMARSAAAVDCFSDDGRPIREARLLRFALEYARAFDAVIADHAEDASLTDGAQMHEGEVSAMLGLAGWPAAAEEMVVARDLLLAELTGGRLHLCHVSTGGRGRAGPGGQGPRGAGHRRGRPPPLHPDRRGRQLLRPGVQGQPAAAREGRRRGGPPRAGRRHP